MYVRTYREDMLARAYEAEKSHGLLTPAKHMVLTLAELVRAFNLGSAHRINSIHIVRLELDNGGYTDSGRYFGVGAPLFELEIEDCGGPYISPNRSFRRVRATSRRALRAELKKLFPNATISR